MNSIFDVQKTSATFLKIEDGNVIYRATYKNMEQRIPVTHQVFFHIPFSEIMQFFNGTLDNTVNASDIVDWLVIEEDVNDGVDTTIPDGYKIYECVNCQNINVKKDNRKITVGACDKCSHPLWNDDVDVD